MEYKTTDDVLREVFTEIELDDDIIPIARVEECMNLFASQEIQRYKESQQKETQLPDIDSNWLKDND